MKKNKEAKRQAAINNAKPDPRKWIKSLLVVIALLTGLAYLYLYPGSQALFNGRTDSFMSDGTDPTPLAYSYDLVLETWKKHPSYFFYGTVYVEGGDPEKGTALWMPWSERWLVLLSSYFFPLEQLSTAFIFCLFIINGLCMYLLCSYLGWARAVSFGLALAWAFNCYTRARAKVHGALVGTYHLPLIFLGLFLIVRGKSYRSLLAAIICLLLAGTTAHYYLVTCVFLSPIFVIFVLVQPDFMKDWKRIGGRFLLGIAPLIIFLGMNYKFPVSSDVNMTKEEYMLSEWTKNQEVSPFLTIFYARLIDFLGGDIALQGLGTDINPLRAQVNKNILTSLDNSNPHERTNGIRWSILIISAFALVALYNGKFKEQLELRNNFLFFFLFALFTLWLASTPNFPAPNAGPAYWIYELFSKVRVPSRSGINVHFALLMITGLFFTTQFKWKKTLLIPGAFAGLMILDYPPLQPMPMAPMYPAYSALQRENGPCGTGLFFPFFNPFMTPGPHYIFTQRMRRTDCPVLNSSIIPERVKLMASVFPPSPEFIKRLPEQPQIMDYLLKLSACMPLNWIVFHEATPKQWAGAVCERLGWQFHADLSCVSPQRNRPVQNYPEKCFKIQN